jgi:hypothetical protein
MLKAYDQAEVIEKKVGEKFDIGPIRELASAGYTWDAIAVTCAHLLDRKTVPGFRPGSPDWVTFTFEAVIPCKCDLEFICWRRWETQIVDKKVYTLIIT